MTRRPALSFAVRSLMKPCLWRIISSGYALVSKKKLALTTGVRLLWRPVPSFLYEKSASRYSSESCQRFILQPL